MKQTYLTSTNQTILNRLRADHRTYTKQRELEKWFENTHHVNIAWENDADGARKVKGVKAITSAVTLTVQGKGDLKGHWLPPMNGVYTPCKSNTEVWGMLRQFEWTPQPLPGVESTHTYTPDMEAFIENGKAYLAMSVESVDDTLWAKSTKKTFDRAKNRYAEGKN